MARTEDLKCLLCGAFFVADARNARHQKYCCAPACRKESKAASHRAWLAKSDNQNYFRGAENVARVKSWREAHPGYWRRPKGQRGKAAPGAAEPIALQEVCPPQPLEIIEAPQDILPTALQDVWLGQPAVVIGFIAHFMGSTLQEDIARSTRRLVQLGTDIMAGRMGDDPQACSLSGPGPADPDAIQLARPPPGAGTLHRAL